jgi:hypothetical protein
MSTSPTTGTDRADDTTHLPDDPALLKAMLAEVLRALRQSQRES